jgi:thiamine kinase-like enzyme
MPLFNHRVLRCAGIALLATLISSSVAAHDEVERASFVCLDGRPMAVYGQKTQDLHERVCDGLSHLLSGLRYDTAVVAPGPRGYNSVDSFFVTHQQQRFHLKILRTQTPEQSSKAQQELRSAQTAADLDLAPGVWSDAADNALLLTRFVDGVSIESADVPAQTVRAAAAQALRTLHNATQTDAVGHIDGARLLARLESIRAAIALRDTLAQNASEQDAMLACYWRWAEHVSAQLDGMPHPISLCHLDMQVGNLLWDGRRLWLLDWGEAALSDPINDYVDFAFNQGMDLRQLVQMLRDSDFDDQAITRGIYRMAWAHVRRYYTLTLGMRWDRPEDRDKNLTALRGMIAQDMLWLGWPQTASASQAACRL